MTKTLLPKPAFGGWQWFAIGCYTISVIIFLTLITFVVETLGHLVLTIAGFVFSHGFLLVGDVLYHVNMIRARHGRTFYLIDERMDDFYFYKSDQIGRPMIDLGVALPNDPDQLRWLKEHDIVRFIHIAPADELLGMVCVKRYIGVKDDKSAMAYRLKWC